MKSALRSATFASPAARTFSIYHRAMHWAVPVLCIVQLPTAWAIQRTHMAHGFFKPAPLDLLLHQVHAWNGWLILLLALAQIALRLRHGRPPVAEGISKLEARVAATVHISLYGLLIALSLTGTVAMYLSYRIAPFHRLLSWSLLAVVLLHVAAALWHHFHRRDDVLRRMIRGS